MKLGRLSVGLAVAAASFALAPAALADGTETLGPPSVSIASGTRVIAAGVGMEAFPNTPNSFTVNLAAGSSNLTISNMSFGSFLGNSGNDGAGVLVVYTPPDTAGTIGIRDGLDLAFSGFAPPLDTTVPQTFTFAASASPRPATISSLLGSVFNEDPVAGFRTSQLRVTFNLGGTGDVTFDNPWQSHQGINFDASNLAVTVPAGATQMTLQALSGGPGAGKPASDRGVRSRRPPPAGPAPPPP